MRRGWLDRRFRRIPKRYGAVTALTGTADDYLTIGQGFFGHQIDLGAGTADTITLRRRRFYTLNLLNVENVVGSSGDDIANLTANAAGLSVDLGGGTTIT